MTMTTKGFEATAGLRTGAVWAALRGVAGWPARVYRARQLMHQLAGLGEHELRDIGLTRLDLHDAGAFPFDADPSVALRRRAEERRRRR